MAAVGLALAACGGDAAVDADSAGWPIFAKGAPEPFDEIRWVAAPSAPDARFRVRVLTAGGAERVELAQSPETTADRWAPTDDGFDPAGWPDQILVVLLEIALDGTASVRENAVLVRPR